MVNQRTEYISIKIVVFWKCSTFWTNCAFFYQMKHWRYFTVFLISIIMKFLIFEYINMCGRYEMVSSKFIPSDRQRELYSSYCLKTFFGFLLFCSSVVRPSVINENMDTYLNWKHFLSDNLSEIRTYHVYWRKHNYQQIAKIMWKQMPCKITHKT